LTHAQQKPEPHSTHEPEQTVPGRQSKSEAEEEKNFPEVEFLASSVFRSFSYLQPLTRGLNFEGHYFGVENVGVGIVNGSWTFRLGKSIELSPGLGVYFGEGQSTSPALSFRWGIERGPIVSQGLFFQVLRQSKRNLEPESEQEEGLAYPRIWDGNHVSYRHRRLEIGPSWERIHGREGDEERGRVAFRIFRNVSAVIFVMAPETEVRGGIIIHPARQEE
jgi:hypothetical protein